ncbi:hypothetical protein BKA56DRAFT_679466 [Ilyonectria sp. MPI-CAGE-AT-0026]|nr:hypothetical protein BKA56DRAFT_679466 [Ilyonectria sp. MPI-CAGE-AT-0026]
MGRPLVLVDPFGGFLPPRNGLTPAMDPGHEPGYLSGAQSIRSSHCSSRNLHGVSTRKPPSQVEPDLLLSKGAGRGVSAMAPQELEERDLSELALVCRDLFNKYATLDPACSAPRKSAARQQERFATSDLAVFTRSNISLDCDEIRALAIE